MKTKITIAMLLLAVFTSFIACEEESVQPSKNYGGKTDQEVVR